MSKKIVHKPVLLNEVLDGLDIKDSETIVDMTLGGAGHLSAIAKSKAKDLNLIGLDADSKAIDIAKKKLKEVAEKNKNKHQIFLENVYFDQLDKVLEKLKIKKIDKVIFDLGFSSFEIEDPERGFSFQKEGPLKMTYADKPNKFQLTAYDVVNSFEEKNLADIIYGFGEEQFSRRIAKAIVEAREENPIETTTQLAEIIRESVPFFYRKGKIHPATKTFQAIRIAVNSELERLKIALNISFEKLSSDGRIAVITFHSLEDRIVKRFFINKYKEGLAILINKKPILPNREELEKNPRSRSAKLRIIKKI